MGAMSGESSRVTTTTPRSSPCGGAGLPLRQSDARAPRDEHAALDDRPADARVPPTGPRQQDALFDLAEAVHPHVWGRGCCPRRGSRDDAPGRDGRVERLAAPVGVGEHELRGRRLRLIGRTGQSGSYRLNSGSPGTSPCWPRSTRRACRCRASTSPPSCSRRRTGRRTPAGRA